MSQPDILNLDQDYTQKYGFHDDIQPVFQTERGLSRRVIEAISYHKNEPKWMREFRLQAYEIFMSKPMPTWGPDLSQLNFDEIVYYIQPTDRKGRSWDEVPEEIKRTFERLGIPEWERKFLAGVGAQYDSFTVYHNLAKQWEEKGVIFVDTDTAVREYPDLVREYFGTVIPPTDNKFAALNSAVWSGGSFVYVPPGVHVDIPLQAYFRINAKNAGQFERTLIIAEEGSFVHYVEGCLPAGEQVCTESGWVNIESVKPGDFVLDEKGRRVKVRAVMTRPYTGEMIVIRPISPHNTIRLTPEHPVLCVRREQVQYKRRARQPHWKVEVDTRLLLEAQPEYVPAGELREGDFIVFPKPVASAEEAPFTAEQLRLLGYYLAEGSAYIHRTLKVPIVTFTVGEHETEVIQDLTYLIEHLTGKRAQVVRQPKRHAVNITAYSHDLMAFCLEHASKGAATKRLSEAIMRLPAEALRPLIDAYFAGDGNICWKGNSEMHRIITASETLARQIQMLLARLGIYASIEHRAGSEDTIQGRRIRRRPQYVVVWTNCRRMGEVRDAGDYFLVPIKQIERVPYNGFVFNLDVEEPHSYLVRGFATHNCTAPVYAEEALHSAVVEIIVKRGARVRYTTIQNWSKDVYNLVTKRAVAYGDSVMEWVDGNLGCVCAGELVYTERGPVPIEQVEPGTRVWSFDEARRLWVLRPVVARKDSGLQQVYEITLSNGRSLRLTANHPLLTVQYDATRPQKLGRYSLRWKPVEALQSGDLIIFPTALQAEGQPYRFVRSELPDQFTGRNQHGAEYPIASHARQPVQLPEYADEDICWLLGLWIAEGDYTIQRGRSGHRYGRVGFSVPTSDRAYPRLISLLTRYFGNHAIELRKDERYLRVNSLEFALWLQANGFVSGAKEKRIPAWVFTLPSTLQAAFLAGYLDGDGCAKGNMLCLKSANRALLQDVQQLALQCGVSRQRGLQPHGGGGHQPHRAREAVHGVPSGLGECRAVAAPSDAYAARATDHAEAGAPPPATSWLPRHAPADPRNGRRAYRGDYPLHRRADLRPRGGGGALVRGERCSGA
jgi:Fe-S cluster assembly protein SufB